MVEATPMENPHLPEGFIKTLMETYDQRWLNRFVYARWEEWTGRVFDLFDPRIHVIEPFEIPKHWARYRGMDWGGPEGVTGSIWIAFDENGQGYAYKEYYSNRGLIRDHTAGILSANREDAIKWTAMCWSGSSRSIETGQSIINQYCNAGLQCFAGIRVPWERKVETINAMLKPTSDEQKPKLLFFRTVENTIREFMEWRFDEEDRWGVQKPVERDDHMIDCVSLVLEQRPGKTMARAEPPHVQRREKLRKYFTEKREWFEKMGATIPRKTRSSRGAQLRRSPIFTSPVG